MTRKTVIICSICQKPVTNKKELRNGRDNEPVCSERCQKDSWADVD